MSHIIAQSVSFAFQDQLILRDLDLRCEAGEFVSILGPSGCGKSTLLRLLAGLLTPTQGKITIGDTEPMRASFVFQKPTLCPWLSVLRNIELPLRIRGVVKSSRQQSIQESIRLVELDRQDCHKKPYQLSGGMQMRVSLARALVTKPKIMLLDEPFSALDEVLRHQLCETCLRLWRQESWTSVFVTHNVAEAVFMSQRIYILAGAPSQLVDVISIPFDRRDRELRSSEPFHRYVSDVSGRLRDAVERQGTIGDAG